MPIPKISVNGNKLLIEVDLAGPRSSSKSGKSDLVSSTNGNLSFPIPGGKPVVIGLNVYEKR